VIVSDNDPKKELKALTSEFQYSNFHYKNSKCSGFENSNFALSYGSGHLLKLHNNTMVFEDSALINLLEFAKENIDKKTVIFYSNGSLGNFSKKNFTSFDAFMKELSFYSSWSNGFTIWKDDFDFNNDLDEYFPQVSLLITQSKKKQFIVCNEPYFKMQSVKKKGNYNIFSVFCKNYLGLLKKAVADKKIQIETLEVIKKDMLFKFLPLNFFKTKVIKVENYSSEGLKKNIDLEYPWYAYYLVVVLGYLFFFYYLFDGCRKILRQSFKLFRA
tara:strand:+ start:645 stop:1460 length:816 start_codon:yes stop_codon:yes gene_type:complete